MNHYYVYAFLREDMTPYYIGKGSGNRAFVKRRAAVAKRPTDLSRIVILEDNLSDLEAYKYEEMLIKLFGRKDNGTGILHNLNDGGIGTRNISESTREKMRLAKLGKSRSEESRKRQSETAKGRAVSNETREKIRQRRIGYTWSDADKRKMSESHSGKILSNNHKDKISKTLTGRAKDPRTPEHSEKLSAALKGKPWSDARRQAQGAKRFQKSIT